ncbi:MAG: hypothetical protein EBT78_17825, partial [Betaproteobacteria bacterium]|nr:hypothetical protein [Betaproteobacteria bacterium]
MTVKRGFLGRTRAILAIFLAVTCHFAAAQNWPNRPIRLVVASAAGGVNDVVARLVAQPLGEALGQPVVVDNKPGSLLGRGSHVLVVHPSVAANNLRELVSVVRQNPKDFSAALPSYGGAQHLALEMIKAAAGLDITPIPYKGGALAVVDVVG